jgi:predicted RND superfamily exporter protein
MRTEDIAGFIYKKPGTCMAIMVVLTVVFSSGLVNFTMTMDMDDMLPKTDEVEYLKTVQDEFFDMEMAAFVTKGEPVLSPTYFQEIADVIETWLEDEDIEGALLADPSISIITIPTMLAQYDLMLNGTLQPTPEQLLTRARSYSDQTQIRVLALAYTSDESIPELYREAFWVLLPKDTPRAPSNVLDPVPEDGAMFVQLRGDMDTADLEDVLLEMEELAKKETDEVTTYVYADGLLGHYMAEAEMMMEPIFLVLVVVLFVVLLIAFRRLSDPGITMASLLLAILWQIGIISWLGFSLDLFQFMVPLLLMGLGIDFSLHLIMNYREGLGIEGTQEERLKSGVDKVFKVTLPALALATVTTMVGFGSNVIFDYPIIVKFGLGAAIGILAVFLVNMFFVLPWRVLRDRRSEKQLEKGTIFVGSIDAEPGPLVRSGFRTLRIAPLLLALLILVAIPGLVLAPTMKGEYDPRDELIEDQDLTIAATTLMEDFSMGTETLYIRVVDDWTSARAWTDLYISMDELERTPYVNKANGSMVADWVGPFIPIYAMLDPGVAVAWANVTEDGQTVSPSASRENLTQMLDSLYAVSPEVKNYLHKDADQYRSILIAIPTTTAWGKHGLALEEDVEEAFGERFETVQATGTPIVWGVGFDVMTTYMVQSIIIVVVFAFIFLIVLNTAKRRDPVLGVITGIPPILVLGWLFVTMYVAGIPLNLMTSMVGAIIIGLGIDYPIHIVNRWAYESDNGDSLRSVYNITLGSTGREIVFSGATTLLALGTFFLLPMEAMRVFGIVLFIAVFYAMVGALVLTPLMLRFWGPKAAKEKVEAQEDTS